MPASRIIVHLNEPGAIIRPELYGHFAEHLGTCIYEGLWVGPDSSIPNVGGFRTDVLDALKRLDIPVLRWPGGCFADDYHWEDGIGPVESRARGVNLWWGHDVETNAFGTHEFINLCRLLGAQPYLAGNLGSGSPGELRNWVEYCNFAGDSTLAKRRAQNGSPAPFNVRCWGVGNEAWGCGGGFSPEDYASEYKRFATYLTSFTRPKLNMLLFLVACGPNGNDLQWTGRFFEKICATTRRSKDIAVHGFGAHYYCWTAGPSATEYNVDQWYELLERAALVEKLIIEQRAKMDEFDPPRKVGLMIDEWGTWHKPTPGKPVLWQQSTLRDALVAAITLDTFNRHCEKLAMCNIAQVVNVLQSMILTEGDRMILTPTFHVFEMYKAHHGARNVRVTIESDDVSFAVGDQRHSMKALSGSASLKDDVLTLSITNCHANVPAEVTIEFAGAEVSEAQLTVLCDADITAHNRFDHQRRLVPLEQSFDPSNSRRMVPSASVNVMTAKLR
jgi:alpha-N-arabinofuranosidase